MIRRRIVQKWSTCAQKKGSNDIHEKQVDDENDYFSSSCEQKKCSYDIHEPSTSSPPPTPGSKEISVMKEGTFRHTHRHVMVSQYPKDLQLLTSW